MKYTRQGINLLYKYWFDYVQKKKFFHVIFSIKSFSKENKSKMAGEK